MGERRIFLLRWKSHGKNKPTWFGLERNSCMLFFFSLPSRVRLLEYGVSEMQHQQNAHRVKYSIQPKQANALCCLRAIYPSVLASTRLHLTAALLSSKQIKARQKFNPEVTFPGYPLSPIPWLSCQTQLRDSDKQPPLHLIGTPYGAVMLRPSPTITKPSMSPGMGW